MTGGDPRSGLVREPDGLSFFQVNLPIYLEREGPEKNLKRNRWGYQRLSPEAKPIVGALDYNKDEINKLVNSIFE